MNSDGNTWTCNVCGWSNTKSFCLQCGTPQKMPAHKSSNDMMPLKNSTPSCITSSSSKKSKNKTTLAEEILEELKSRFIIDSVYFKNSSEKARTKISAAIDAYGGGIPKNDIVLACQDDTLFGSSDTGCIFTMRGIYIKPMFSSLEFIRYQDIQEIYLDKDRIHVHINDTKIMASMVGKTHINRFYDMIIFLRDRLGRTDPPDNSQSKFCTNCGAKITSNSNFCTSCGTRLI